MTDRQIRRRVLASKIRRARKAKNWSCAQLDIAMGWEVKNEITSKVERSIREVDFVEVEDIARHLRVGIAKLQTIRKARATQKAKVMTALRAGSRLVGIKTKKGERYRLEDSQKREQPVSQRLGNRLTKGGNDGRQKILKTLSVDPRRSRTYYGI
jgi:hypothetical protein